MSCLMWTVANAWMGFLSHLVLCFCLDAVPFISHVDLCFGLDASPCHPLPGPLLRPRCESVLSFTWTTARTLVGDIPVIPHQDLGSCLYGSPYHLSCGPLHPPGWEFLSSLTWTTAPTWMKIHDIFLLEHCSCLDGRPYHLTWYSTPTSIGVPIICHMEHRSCPDASLCHVSPGPLLLPGGESLSSLPWNIFPA